MGRRAQSLAEKMTKSLESRTVELSRSNAELERFAYAASHDLRSPLRAIGSLASWLEEDLGNAASSECRQHLSLMRSRIKRLDDLLDGLLQYSRIGRVTHDIKLVDSNILVRDIVDLADIPDGFAVTIAENLPVFHTAETPLTQVLHNLISNAIKHHDRDTGSITIEGEDLGTHVSFTVADDGPGIAEEYHEKIFGMFETLKRRDVVEASGMGLAIVKRQVGEHNGIIELGSSAAERGSTFHFTWEKAAPQERSDDAT
jgi:light-regulated signal transduction histidine kinase (bacteriophytochrome)